MDHILVFGGKGGVGKSSISTATAVYLAKQLKDKKILLVSFDIAHNLSDLFDIKIGNDITQITQNLFAIEPDPDKYTEKYTHELTTKTRTLLKSSFLVSIIPELDSIIEDSIQGNNITLAMKNALFFQSILDAENPMEEIGEKGYTYNSKSFNSTKTTEPSEKNPSEKDSSEQEQNDSQFLHAIPAFDIVVCDFPPTGNMIALFEVPQDSNQRLMKLALNITSSITKQFQKLKKLTKVFRPASWLAGKMVTDQRDEQDILDKEEQKNLAQDILDILHDMELRSERISKLMQGIGSLRLVSIAEKPSFEEAKRAREMSSPYIHVDAIHLNRLIPEEERGKNHFLDQIIATQDVIQTKSKEEFQDLKIWESNLMDHPPIGQKGLLKLAQEVYKDTDIFDIINPLHRFLVNPEKKVEENPFNIDKIKKNWKES
ncbi:MAG: ArsA family ATPase [Promethearchaeota archaeon]